MTDTFIPPHGGYENLLSYRKDESMTRARIEARSRKKS